MPPTKDQNTNNILEEIPLTTYSPGLVTWSSNSDEVATKAPEIASTATSPGNINIMLQYFPMFCIILLYHDDTTTLNYNINLMVPLIVRLIIILRDANIR